MPARHTLKQQLKILKYRDSIIHWYRQTGRHSGPGSVYIAPKATNSVMYTFLKVFVVLVLALALIGWLADRRAAANRPDVTPGLSFLPGDVKYESPNGNVRIYFPIVTSIVISVLLTLILRFFS